MEKIKKTNKICILNKITHKPILFDYIFPFIEKKPLIFTSLIDNDIILKEKVNSILDPISKSNKLSKNINDNMYKFLISRFLYEINLEIILKELKEKMIKESNEYMPFISYFFSCNTEKNYLINNNQCILDYIFELLIEKIKKKVNSVINIDIKYSKSLNKIYKSKQFINFIIDYLHIQKEILLFHLPFNKKDEKTQKESEDKKEEDNEDDDNDDNDDDDDDDDDNGPNLLWNKRNIYGDSYYIDNLNNNINQKINLICKIDKKICNVNPFQFEYNNINKLYFLLYENNKNKTGENKNILETIKKYLISIKHKENIEEIYFSNAFFNEEKNEFLYEKLYLEEIVEIFAKNIDNTDYQFKSLKKIEFNDDKIINNIRRFKFRYNLNKIFGNNIWSKIIIINYKEIEMIYENKTEEKSIVNIMHRFDDDNNNLKILLIDLQYNSPYQNKFYNFCKTYLDNNPQINMLVFHKVGSFNYEEDFCNNNNNNTKIILPNLTQVYYERDIEEKNNNNIAIYDFINRFFDINKLYKYKGYDDINSLNYLNISSNSMEEEELNRIFLEENKISLFHLEQENIQIKYNRNKNHLIINHINHTNTNNNSELNIQEKNISNKPLSFFSNIIRGLDNIQKLTINGFDFSFYHIINNNIYSLSINSLNEYASKKYKHINISNTKDYENDWNNFSSFQYLQLFKNLEYLTISENFRFLEEIILHLNQNTKLKKIKFYTCDNNTNKLNDIQKKIELNKNISLEIIQTNLNKYNYEDEEYLENEKNSNIQNKNNIIKKHIIHNLNWLNSFDSQIIKELDIKYIEKIINIFSKIYLRMDIQPYNFSFIKRYKFSDIETDKNENILSFYKKKENLLIIVNDISNKEKFYGYYRTQIYNNNEGIFFYNNNQEIFYKKIRCIDFKVEIYEQSNFILTIYFMRPDTYYYKTDDTRYCNCIEVFELL